MAKALVLRVSHPDFVINDDRQLEQFVEGAAEGIEEDAAAMPGLDVTVVIESAKAVFTVKHDDTFEGRLMAEKYAAMVTKAASLAVLDMADVAVNDDEILQCYSFEITRDVEVD